MTAQEQADKFKLKYGSNATKVARECFNAVKLNSNTFEAYWQDVINCTMIKLVPEHFLDSVNTVVSYINDPLLKGSYYSDDGQYCILIDKTLQSKSHTEFGTHQNITVSVNPANVNHYNHYFLFFLLLQPIYKNTPEFNYHDEYESDICVSDYVIQHKISNGDKEADIISGIISGFSTMLREYPNLNMAQRYVNIVKHLENY